ncbi:hypothetical protein SDJN03_24980, partial [Cucurbita argyrosperma subsp. sororia]
MRKQLESKGRVEIVRAQRKLWTAEGAGQERNWKRAKERSWSSEARPWLPLFLPQTRLREVLGGLYKWIMQSQTARIEEDAAAHLNGAVLPNQEEC